MILAELAVGSGLLLCFGKLGDRCGHRSVYRLGLIVFSMAALSCAAAPRLLWLAMLRMVQGAAAAMVLASAPALLTKHLPAGRRGYAMGWRAALIYLGLFLGSAVGGWLAHQFGWRAIFLAQFPVGLLAWALGSLFIPADSLPRSHPRLDLSGALAWLLALAALVFGLNQGQAWGWTSPPVVGSIAASIFLLALFLRVERRADDALLDLSLFADPSFSIASSSLVLSFVSSHLLAFLLPFYLIQARHLPAASAGLLLAVHALVRAWAAPWSGTWSDRLGPRPLMVVGMTTFAGGVLLLGGLEEHSGIARIAAGIVLAGMGAGIFVPCNNSMLMGSVPRARQGVAAAVLATSRNTGMALGVALATALVSSSRAAVRALPGPALTAGLHTAWVVSAAIAILAAIISAVPFVSRAPAVNAAPSASSL